MQVMEMLAEKIRDSLEFVSCDFSKKDFILNWYAKKDVIDFIESTSNDPLDIDYHPFSIHDGVSEMPQDCAKRFDKYPLLLDAFIDSYSLDLPNSDANIYCSLFYVRKQEIDGFEYIRISLNNTLYCDTLDEMGGFEEQFYPNACADEIEELSAILSVRDVVNNSIAAEDGFYFVLAL